MSTFQDRRQHQGQGPAQGEAPARQVTFQDDVDALRRKGPLLPILERIRLAIHDIRLERGHLKVLAATTEYLNATMGTAWPSRKAIALYAGMSEAAVSNTFYELRRFGYVVWERRPNPTGKGRPLLQYTLPEARHSLERLREDVAKAIEARRPTTPPTVWSRPQLHRPRCSPTPPTTPPTVESNYTAHGVQELSYGTRNEDSSIGRSQARAPNGANAILPLEGEVLGPGSQPNGRPYRAQRRTRLPYEAVLSEDWLRIAVDKGLTEQEASEQFDEFKLHHVGHGTLMQVWVLAWHKWLNNAVRWGTTGPNKRKRNGGVSAAAYEAFNGKAS